MTTPTFRTAAVRTPGGPDAIEILHVPLAEPGTGQVRVAIAAAAVNPVDLGVANGLFHARGLIHQPERTGLGWEFAGTIDAVGPGRTRRSAPMSLGSSIDSTATLAPTPNIWWSRPPTSPRCPRVWT